MIRESAHQVKALANEHNLKKVLINFPGIGNGGLGKRVAEIQEMLNTILDDRFVIIRKKGE
jgi:hypothetical protein